MLIAVRQVDRVIEKSVFFVPQRDAVGAMLVDGLRDVDEVLEKFAGHVFVGRILARKFQRDGQHVQAIHPHPAGAVGLLEVPARGQRLRAVKHADVVEAQESALKYVHAVGILAIHPPGEIQQQFVEDALEKAAVGAPADALLDLVHAPRRPGVHRRIHVAERPLVGRQLPVRMHVPFAQQQDELLLGKIRIDQRQRDV